MKEKIISLLAAAKKLITEQYQKSNQNWKEKQTARRSYLLHQCICDMANQMTVDLYTAFQVHDYNPLAPIVTPQSIRFIKYIIRDGRYLYQFALDKKSCDKIIAYLLDELQQKMNYDIAAAQRQLINLYGYDNVYLIYPFLYHGIYVVSIQDLKISSVVITVQTQITPENFGKIYRQFCL